MESHRSQRNDSIEYDTNEKFQINKPNPNNLENE